VSCESACSIPGWKVSSRLAATPPDSSTQASRNCADDLSNLSPIEGRLSGYDACFFCLGVSAAGMNEQAYRRVTYDLTISLAEH